MSVSDEELYANLNKAEAMVKMLPDGLKKRTLTYINFELRGTLERTLDLEKRHNNGESIFTEAIELAKDMAGLDEMKELALRM